VNVFGVVGGMLFGYLCGTLPVYVRKVRNWRQERVQADIARIQGAFKGHRYVPIKAPPTPLFERMIDRAVAWWQSTAPDPLTPERVAQRAYEREVLRWQ
jgi:hypothetical protein